MSGPAFHETGTGHKFYEAQLPELIRAIGRLADGIHRLAEALAAQPAGPATSGEPRPNADRSRRRGEETTP